MTVDIGKTESTIREKRLSAITGYQGSIRDLVGQAGGCGLRNRERGFSQTSCCSSGCAHTILTMVLDAAVVNHAPVGCIGDSLYQNATNHWNQHLRGDKYTNIPIISTNMTEHDAVFGGGDKLRDALRQAYRRFKPKAIFVTSSCASGIIGDDIQGIIDSMADEIPATIAAVYCDGFRSRVWASGFDAAYHAILTKIVKPPREKHPERVNVINFWGREKKQITRLFAKIGLVPQFVISFATIDELERISEAGATVMNCQTLGSYLGAGLEEHFGVPLVKSLPPFGIAGMDDWLRELGKVVDKEPEVENLIAEEKASIGPELDELRTRLSGKRVYLAMGPGFGHGMLGVLQELGLDVARATSWHYDQIHDHGSRPAATQKLACGRKDIPFSVNDHQNYEILSLLRQTNPDLYITRHVGTAVWAAKMGIPAIAILDEYAAFGYQGLISFGWRVVDALANRAFAKKLAGRVKLPYSDWWWHQDAFRFLEEAG